MNDDYIRLEKAQGKDIASMQQLWHMVPGVGLGRGDDQLSLRSFLKRNPESCLVLKNDGEIIGAVLGGFDGRRGYIYHLAIHPHYQGRGYGKMLVKKVCAELKIMGAQKIHLFAFHDNEPALEFYVKQGWIKRRDIQVMSYDTSLVPENDTCC